MTLRNPTRLTRRAVAMPILVIFLTGCAAAPPGSPAGGAGADASATGSRSTPTAPTAPTAPPVSAPAAGGLGGAPIPLTQGSAHLTISGGASQAFGLALSSGVLVPDTNVILAWSGPSSGKSHDDALRIQAPSKAGVYKSSGTDFGAPAISVSTGRIGTAGSPPQFAPARDECTVTLTKVDATGVEGILQCTGLTSTGYDKPIDVQATFMATP